MDTAGYELVIGSKMWSSWSLRPWILMRHYAIPFKEHLIALRTPQTDAAIAAVSPSGKIPALRVMDGAKVAHTVWDSLAIIDYLAAMHPELPVWPRDRDALARARSIAAEMHAGFQPLRQNCPMDFAARGLTPAEPSAIAADVARICAIWTACRSEFGAAGPYLLGAFSAADAMYAPVVSRFMTYGLSPPGDTQVSGYIATIASHSAFAEWAHGAALEMNTVAG